MCPVPDGATLTFKYHIAPNDPTSGGIAYSHVGPCAVYLKKVEDAIYDGAAGDGWFKLWDMGYTDQWCTIKVNEAGGLLTVNLPKGLVGGYYLVRPELLALHQAKDGNPQYYVSCAQVYVQSSGDLVPKGTVSIPGYCTVADAANSFNVYDGTPPSSYKCGGPAPVALVNGGFNNGNTPIVNGGFNNGNTPMDKGGRPKGCILEIGSWCGKEVPSYSDQQGCWVVSCPSSVLMSNRLTPVLRPRRTAGIKNAGRTLQQRCKRIATFGRPSARILPFNVPVATGMDHPMLAKILLHQRRRSRYLHHQDQPGLQMPIHQNITMPIKPLLPPTTRRRRPHRAMSKLHLLRLPLMSSHRRLHSTKPLHHHNLQRRRRPRSRLTSLSAGVAGNAARSRWSSRNPRSLGY